MELDLDEQLSQMCQAKKQALESLEIKQENPHEPYESLRHAKKKHKQILMEVHLCQERLKLMEETKRPAKKLKIMETNYWSFVNVMKPLWENEISDVSK